MFERFKTFWNVFIDSIKQAYNKAFKPIEDTVQSWRDTGKINLLDIFVGKLNNLANTEATFEVISDSTQAEPLKKLCKDIEDKRFNITAEMLATGDYYIFPATNSKGEIIHSYLTQQQVRILDMDGESITEAYGIIDWYIDKSNKVYYLLRHHKLDLNGTLNISYSVMSDNGKKTTLDRWADLDGREYSFINANHIGFGRYKSPIDSRGKSPVYGVPLNYGCGEIEQRIFNDYKLIEDEFTNGKSVIFTDPRNLMKDEERKQYRIADNIIPIQSRAGQTGSNIDIFNPELRWTPHYSKLVEDMAIYERQVGTSKGILTDNETAYTATATAVKRANSDTMSLIDKIHNSVDVGNEMTLKADSVFLNISPELWQYKSDYYDPFEDPAEQWQRLIEAKQNNVAESADLVKWLFPNMSDDEIQEKLQRIDESIQSDTASAIERAMNY